MLNGPNSPELFKIFSCTWSILRHFNKFGEIKWIIRRITLSVFDTDQLGQSYGIPLNDIIKFKVTYDPYKYFGILGKPLHHQLYRDLWPASRRNVIAILFRLQPWRVSRKWSSPPPTFILHALCPKSMHTSEFFNFSTPGLVSHQLPQLVSQVRFSCLTSYILPRSWYKHSRPWQVFWKGLLKAELLNP